MSIFEQYRNCINSIKSLSPSSNPHFSAQWQQTLQNLFNLNQLINSLSLSFSKNETQEDISTNNIPFLLISYYIAICLKWSPEKDPEKRSFHLQQATGYFNKFLEDIAWLKLLGEIAGKYQDKEGAFQLPSSATDKRELKVLGFKRRREIEEKLNNLAFDEVQWLVEEGQQSESVEEEVRRQLWFLQIELCVLDSIDQISGLEREIQMLEIAKKRKDNPQAQQGNFVQTQQPQSSPVVLLGNNRQTQYDQVFKPFHNLPTMTVEQFGEQELKRLKERHEREARLKAEYVERNISKDEQEEEELKKAREWDEFKDDNPAGWGNSKLRPCA